MIKFYDDKVVYTRTVKTNKHKKLLLRFELENSYYLRVYKQRFEDWKTQIQRYYKDVQFKNNIVTEKFFIGE